MSDYDNQPCSVFYPNQQSVPAPVAVPPIQAILNRAANHPRVVENLTPQKPAEEAPVAVKKKSCLSTASSRRPIPDHPANHRKTVAFGKTVNVSQTVEATSRTAKKMASTSSATSSPAQRANETANFGAVAVVENGQEDWRKIMKDELETMRREMQEDTVKRQEALNNENLNKMQEMMSQFMQQLVVSKATAAAEDKENNYERRHQEPRPKPPNKIAIARQIIKKEGRIPPEAIPLLEKRIQSDPIFRQQVDDVLADAEYESNRNTYSPPQPVSYVGGNTNGNPSLMRETLTVERSIRYDNGLASLDSRQWTKERDAGTGRAGQDRWRNYEPDPILHSTYQPGNSVSYYPSAADKNRQNRGRNNGYYVEHTSDQEEDEVVDDYVESVGEESAVERERRIREKYSRK